MNVARKFARLAFGAIIIFVGLYFAISLGVTFFKLSGEIIEGQPMYFDLATPTWLELLTFQAACVAIMGIGFLLRRKLQMDRL